MGWGKFTDRITRAGALWLITIGVLLSASGCTLQTPPYSGETASARTTQADTLGTVWPPTPTVGDTIQATHDSSALAQDDSTARDIATAVGRNLDRPAGEDTVRVMTDQVAASHPEAPASPASSAMNPADSSFTPLAEVSDASPPSKAASGFEPHAPDTISIAFSSPTERSVPSAKRVPVESRRDVLQDSDGDGVPDSRDLCDHTPLNAIVNQAGCPLDGDGDGVYDGIDQCPGTPNFVRMVVDSVGCPADEDDDGVPDYLDYCPGTPYGFEVTKLGCLPDGDADGIADIYDHCPDTPKGMDVDSTGCLIMTQLQRQLALQINYVPGTTQLDRLSRRILDDLAIRMAESPHVIAVIDGFTENLPNTLSALVSSRNHVAQVIQYLADHGVDEDRIRASNVSDEDHIMVVNGADSAGQPENYRIEISFYSVDE